MTQDSVASLQLRDSRARWLFVLDDLTPRLVDTLPTVGLVLTGLVPQRLLMRVELLGQLADHRFGVGLAIEPDGPPSP